MCKVPESDEPKEPLLPLNNNLMSTSCHTKKCVLIDILQINRMWNTSVRLICVTTIVSSLTINQMNTGDDNDRNVMSLITCVCFITILKGKCQIYDNDETIA